MTNPQIPQQPEDGEKHPIWPWALLSAAVLATIFLGTVMTAPTRTTATPPVTYTATAVPQTSDALPSATPTTTTEVVTPSTVVRTVTTDDPSIRESVFVSQMYFERIARPGATKAEIVHAGRRTCELLDSGSSVTDVLTFAYQVSAAKGPRTVELSVVAFCPQYTAEIRRVTNGG